MTEQLDTRDAEAAEERTVCAACGAEIRRPYGLTVIAEFRRDRASGAVQPTGRLWCRAECRDATLVQERGLGRDGRLGAVRP